MFHGINDNGISRFGVIGSIGSLPVTIYGFLVVSGFVLAVILCAIKLKKFYKVSYDPFLKFAVVAFPFGIFFASVWSYAIGNSRAWYDGFTGQGGLAIQGGVTMATILGLIWFPIMLRQKKYWINVPLGKGDQIEAVKRISTWVYFDAIVPVVLIGQAIGRWGNFFNYEVFGQQVGNMNYQEAIAAIQANNTNIVPLNWLRLTMPGVWSNMWIANNVVNSGTFANPSVEWATAARIHEPLFLYESFFNVIVFLIIYSGLLNLIKGYKVGIIGSLAIAYTAIFRIITEPLRFNGGDNLKFGYSQSLVFSILLLILAILVGLYAFFINGNKKIRHVKWFMFIGDKIKYFLYSNPFIRNHLITYAQFQDRIIKTALTVNISNDLNRYKKLAQILLIDYVITNKDLKYYGPLNIKLFKKQIWMSN